MKASVTELPNSRVRVEAEVPAEDVERGINRAARGLARDMRLPGRRLRGVNRSLRISCEATAKLKKYGYPIVKPQPFLSFSTDLG